MNILDITDVPTDLDPNDVQVDDPDELREDRDDDREEEEPDQARGLRGAADPPDQAGEEEREAEADQDVSEDLEEVKIEAVEVKVVSASDQGSRGCEMDRRCFCQRNVVFCFESGDSQLNFQTRKRHAPKNSEDPSKRCISDRRREETHF